MLATNTSGARCCRRPPGSGPMETNATTEPSALMAGAVLAPPGAPLGGWLTSRTAAPGMSRRKTSVSGFWSAPVVGRLVASDAKATLVPSALIDGPVAVAGRRRLVRAPVGVVGAVAHRRLDDRAVGQGHVDVGVVGHGARRVVAVEAGEARWRRTGRPPNRRWPPTAGSSTCRSAPAGTGCSCPGAAC